MAYNGAETQEKVMKAAGVRRKHLSTTNPYDELEAMVLSMARMLVDHPDEVVVDAARGQEFVAFEVICGERDAGSLIGQRGKHAEAMRLLLMAAGAVRRIRVTVQFRSRDDDVLPPR
jgi:predicted RNA-binding protein YlqC (UPF0109 family)